MWKWWVKSYLHHIRTIKDRRTSSNISLTVYDNKAEYMISNKY